MSGHGDCPSCNAWICYSWLITPLHSLAEDSTVLLPQQGCQARPSKDAKLKTCSLLVVDVSHVCTHLNAVITKAEA